VDNDCDGDVDGDDADVTEVPGGIMATSETFTAADSPYCFSGTVQVAPGATLTMEPGTVVGGGNQSLQVFGRLEVAGAPGDLVEISDLTIIPDGPGDSPVVLDIQYAHVTRGEFSLMGYDYQFLLTDSVVVDQPNGIYVWYPTADCFIERNVFVLVDGISVGLSSVNATVNNNVFYQWYSDYAVENWNAGASTMEVHYNTFLHTDRVAVRVGMEGGGSMDATDNYWSTVDIATIESMIYDQNDDLACGGIIPYLPYLTAPHPDTPDPTPYLP